MQKTDVLILMIYKLYDVFLHKKLSFGGCDDCICVKIFLCSVKLLFLIMINSLMC